MEIFVNILLSSLSFVASMTIILFVHEIGHYFVARCIMKEPDVKIIMGFFGKKIFDSKRLRINAMFFLGGYVGGYSEGESKKSHMIMLFAAGGVFTILLAIPVALYLSGSVSLGDFIFFLPNSPEREGLFSVPLESFGMFTIPWLSLNTPLDFLNMFIRHNRTIIQYFILLALVPYAYPFKGTGKWHMNPSDGLWVLKYIFNKVSDKDIANAIGAVNENVDEKQENK